MKKLKQTLHFILAMGGYVVTSIVLEHTLYTSIQLSQSSTPIKPSPINIPDVPRPQQPTSRPIYYSVTRSTTKRPKQKPTVRPRPTTTTVGFSNGIKHNIFFNLSQHSDCGRTAQDSDINPLISKGWKISRGQWPWLAAIFLVKIEFEFQCAGTILTNKHVITGALKISLRYRPVSPCTG